MQRVLSSEQHIDVNPKLDTIIESREMHHAAGLRANFAMHVSEDFGKDERAIVGNPGSRIQIPYYIYLRWRRPLLPYQNRTFKRII